MARVVSIERGGKREMTRRRERNKKKEKEISSLFFDQTFEWPKMKGESNGKREYDFLFLFSLNIR
jgi:hypothetical protein